MQFFWKSFFRIFVHRPKQSSEWIGAFVFWGTFDVWIIYLTFYCFPIRLGGLDLSRSRLLISTLAESRSRQSRFSRQFEKRHLDSRDFLNSLKNDISTNLDNFYAIKSWFVSIFIFVSISTFQKPTSRHFKKVSLDAKDVLDLDWSRLSRPPWLFPIPTCLNSPNLI